MDTNDNVTERTIGGRHFIDICGGSNPETRARLHEMVFRGDVDGYVNLRAHAKAMGVSYNTVTTYR